jgi:predicted nucleotidyltransferase
MIKGLTQNEQSALKELKARLQDRYPKNLVALKLYGSKARGEGKPESDIDILIIVKERTAAFDEDTINIVCDVLNQYEVFIETVTMTENAYQEALDLQMPFALNVEREAKTL